MSQSPGSNSRSTNSIQALNRQHDQMQLKKGVENTSRPPVIRAKIARIATPIGRDFIQCLLI
jgi:hypothetical protein